jgi:ketosteroid isomerase-like protein
MPDSWDIQQISERYSAAWANCDLDTVCALLAPNAVLHDPVDNPAREGVEAIRAYFEAALPVMRGHRLSGPVYTSGDGRHAVAPIEFVVDLGRGLEVYENVDVFTLDDEGRIVTIDAYYRPPLTG